MKEPTFSIIICAYRIADRFYRDLAKFKDLTFKDFELLIVTEKNENLNMHKIKSLELPIRIIKVKKSKISLGEKRDVGYQSARGEFCAYIDDDAYPDSDWLGNAYQDFKEDAKIGVLGGPNLTPKEDGYWEKIGGYIYESYFTSGGAQYRYLPRRKRQVPEVQGVNMIMPKKILEELGGFHYDLNCADDGKVCSDVKRLGYKIMYDPKIFVYHHRRKFPLPHLKQVSGMGTHRGYFLKVYPEMFAFAYLLPSILSAGFFFGLIGSFFSEILRIGFLILGTSFFFIGYFSSLQRAGIFTSLIVSVGIFATHIAYGTSFIKGIFASGLKN